MNKKKLESLKQLVKTLNEENSEFDIVYTIEAHPFQRGSYHVDISTDATMFSDDLSAFVSWAADNDVLCWASAYHSYLTLHLQ